MERIDKRSKKWRGMSNQDKAKYLQWEQEQKDIKSANAGGARPGAGRKPKADEIALIEKLDSIIDQDDVIDVLSTLILQSGDFKALQLYFQYRFGKPKESIDITSGGDKFDMPIIKFFSTDDD